MLTVMKLNGCIEFEGQCLPTRTMHGKLSFSPVKLALKRQARLISVKARLIVQYREDNLLPCCLLFAWYI